MARVIRGRLIEVDNKERKFGSSDTYLSVWVEDSNGENERCLLFTDIEIQIAQKRAEKNIEDLPKKSFLTDLSD